MCLSILEIVFLIGGLWLVVSGKLPGRLFQSMFGSGNYVMPPKQVRLLGLLLVSPLPIVVMVTWFLHLVLSQAALEWAATFEVFYDVAIAVSAVVLVRRSRQPDQPKPDGVVG